MNEISIKELEKFSGIKAHTLRIWEQRYHFLKPKRTKTNIRYFTNDDLKVVLNVSLLNRHGFKVSQIDRMKTSEIENSVNQLAGAEAGRERVINSLIVEMNALHEEQFEKMINEYSQVQGLHETLMLVLLPFLERTGIFWKTGEIWPAQEQMVLNIIRQKLIVGIETTVPPKNSRKQALLFLPEGIRQEIGLLFINYLLRQRGIQVIYLGTDVPLADVEYLVKRKKPDILFVHLTDPAKQVQIGQFVTDIRYRLAGVRTIISGLPVLRFRKQVPAGIQLQSTLPQLLAAIQSV